MKSRILILVLVVLCATGMLALALSAFSQIDPKLSAGSQTFIEPVLGQAPQADLAAQVGSAAKQPVSDASSEAPALAAAQIADDPDPALQTEPGDIPWRPPAASTNPLEQTNALEAGRQAHQPGANFAQSGYDGPAGRPGDMGDGRAMAVSPVASVDLKDEEKPFEPPSPEAVEIPEAGLSVDMAYDVVFGVVSPGDLVTATALSGGAFGSALADGAGYFFTPLWGTDGRPLDLVGGETIDIYVNGVLQQSITPPVFAGEVNVATDEVVGSIQGLSLGTPLTVSLGIWGWQPNTETPQTTTATDNGGAFTAAFSADLGPHNLARVEAEIDGGRVYYYAYPQNVFNVDTFDYIFGYAQPGQLVTITVYVGNTSEVRGAQSVKANAPHGDYSAEIKVAPGDNVEVDLGEGNLLSMETDLLTAQVDTANEGVTGQAPALQPVRVFVFNWLLGEYAETSTTADASGNYTATFSAYDLTARDAVFPAYAAGSGSEVLLSAFQPGITVLPDQNAVYGNGDAPNTPFTYTLDHAGLIYTQSGQTDLFNGTGTIDFNPQGVEISAGDVITLETPTWSGTMVVADLNFSADSANDRYVGSADQPGEVAVASFAWPAWTHPLFWHASGSAPASSDFSISLPGHDVRAGVSGRILHYDANDFVTRKNFEVRFFELDLPWGLNAPQYNPDEVITATLYASDQTTIKRQVSRDDDGNPEWYWLDFSGEIAAGDWMSVTNGSDWTEWLQVPDLSLEADRLTDLISGAAPETLLYMDMGSPQGSYGGWMPTFADGAGSHFVVDASAFGVDLDFGAWATVYYQALDGNRARRSFGFPDLYARYNPDGSSSVFGNNATPGNTIYITITNSLDEIVASGATSAGTAWMGPTSYNLDFPDYGFVPGDVVHIDYGGGLTNTLLVVELTAQTDIDADLVTGLAPANSTLYAWINDATGANKAGLEQALVSSSGTYTLDFGTVGWDVKNGDSYSVYYEAGHGGVVERAVSLPRPELVLSNYNTPGGAHPGGPYAYGVWVGNDGDLAAQDVQVVFSLPPSTTWAGDTSGMTPQIGADGVITWSLGTLEAQERHNWFLTVLLDPAHPTGDEALAPLCGSIATSTPGDSNPDDNSSCAGNTFVQDEDIEFRVDKWPNMSDVLPGQEFVYELQYCTPRNTAAGPVWLTDTLPASTTFVSLEPRSWWGEARWSEMAVIDGVLELYFPSMPGQNCTSMNLRLRADDGLPLNTVFSNRAELYTAGDVDTSNNVHVNEDARTSTERPDLRLGKYLDNGMLVPGGELNYRLDYQNDGNIALNGRITDTLPAGTAYVQDSAHDDNGQPVDPILVTANQVVWDLGLIGVQKGAGLNYRASIDLAVTPGTVLLNCAVIVHPAEESSPWNNTACDEHSVYEHGPNLHVRTQYWWNGDSQLGFQIDFANFGDETVSSFWITDVLPENTQWDGWWDWSWDWNRLVNTDHSSSQLRWELRDIYPSDSGWIQFNANLDDPNARPRWYTNTASISLYPEDTDPADNAAEVTAVLGELERVEFWVGTDQSDMWGEAQPDTTVTVLNRGITYTAYADPGCGGCWNIGYIGPVWPGDTFTVTAGAGLLPVVVHVPDPFSVAADSVSDQVTGQLGVDPGSWLRAELYDYSGMDAYVDASGYYTAAFTDIPRGGQGHIRYETTVNYALVDFHRRYQTPDLIMGTNVAHDWVQGNYEVGHTVWITVTESDGVTERAHAQVPTYNIPWWGGRPGFEPQSEEWVPAQPDIQTGDWVYGLLDTGYTSTIHIGSITGVVDPGNDRITGTVLADWISQPVNIWCHTWGAPDNNVPGKGDTILPDGVDEYACAWDPMSEWDVLGGQEIGVQYTEPDGDSVYNVFHAASPDLRVQINPESNPGAGGGMQFQVQYINQGDMASENVVITQTFQGMEYLGNLSGFGTITGTTSGGDPYVVYQLGTIPPGDWQHFYAFAQVAAPAGQNITSTVEIFGTPDGGNPGDKQRSWSGQVQANDTHINLGKGAWTGDPTPGGQFIWAVNACSNGSTASSAVYITDTLPAHMTLLDWWGQNPGWTEVSRDAAQLVVMRPMLPNGWCSQVYLRFQVDADAPLNTNILNSADVWAASDLETNDNHTESGVNINNPHTNLYTGMWWGGGSLVPGGTFRFHMDIGNNGNVPVGPFWVTDTLPVSITLEHINLYDQDWNFIESITPTYLPGNQVAWQMGGMENGFSRRIEVMVRADDNAAPGLTLVNTIEIDGLPGEDTYTDNSASWTETLFDHGPNLRLTLAQRWNSDSQLWYQIDFANVGDQTVSSFDITDVLPANTQWDGWWNWGWDWNRLVSTDLSSSQLNWQLRDIGPADGGWIQFNANLVDPNLRPAWYTNTATITLDPADANPADNTASDTQVLGQVERVELWVGQGSNGIWGEAQPDISVTITTPSEQILTWADPSCGGCWGIGTSSSLLPGDLITVAAGSGALPVHIQVPDPFTALADSSSDSVWGQIDNLDHQPLRVDLYGHSGVDVQTDASGGFTATFPDIPPAGDGQVRYDSTIDYARVHMYHRFQADDVLLNINISHDWLQAVYPAGHTVWITVTNSLGDTKGTYQGITNVNGAWDGKEGFQTEGHLWSPGQPDIELGDWVSARSDDGRTAQVHVGMITGELDLLTDSISGTITAPFATPLRTICQVWVENGPAQIELSVDPAGGSYACSWAGVYDIQPDVSVAVSYYEPLGHRVVYIFQVNTPQIYINKWADSQPGEGGNFIFHINYQNQGGGPAEDVVITDTLPAGMTYLSDTAPFPLTSSDPLVWDLGSLPGGSNGTFDVHAHVDASAGTVLTNTARIETSTPWDTAPPENKVSVWTGSVQPSDVQVNVGIGSHEGNPAPGYQFLYEISPCNWGSTSSAEVTVTETLPISITLVSWWGQGPGWVEYSRSEHQLVLKRLTIPNGQCQNFYVLAEMNADVPVGRSLLNTVHIESPDDADPGDNESSTWVIAGDPWVNLYITKTWNRGWLTPGGLLYYNINIGTNGNARPQGLLITDTLPANTSFYQANYGPDVTVASSGPGYIVWQVSGADNNWNGNFEVVLQVDPAAAPGTVLTNTVQIGAVGAYPQDNNIQDNLAQVVKTLNPAGPNLKVSKTPTLFNQDWLRYIITFENLGSEAIQNVEILDTLPPGLTYNGNWDYNFDWGRFQGFDDLGGAVRLRMSSLYPGEAGSLEIRANLDNPDQRPVWYNNLVEITTPAGDTNPADNSYLDETLLGEVTRITLQVGAQHAAINGDAAHLSSVSVETAAGVYTTQADDGTGWWYLNDIGPVQPGDVITITAGASLQPLVIHVPDPFSVNIDTDLEQVWGQIAGSAGQQVLIEGHWFAGSSLVIAGADGAYTALYGDIPYGADGIVHTTRSIDNIPVSFYRNFKDPYVNLAVDKSGTSTPAPGGNFSYSINYRNESDDRASDTVITDTLPTGMTYLSDTSGYPVSVNGSQVVWQLGELGNLSNRFQLVVAVDPGLLPGTELVNTVQIGTSTSEWNYGDNAYQWSINASANDTHLNIGFSPSLGDPAPGSDYDYNFNVCNNGNTASASVLLTTTLPAATTLLSWSGPGWSEQSFDGSQLVLNNASIAGWSCSGGSLHVLLEPSTNVGTLLEAYTIIAASNDMETADNTALYQHNAGAPRINQAVSQYFNSGLLVPGSVLQFQIPYSYDANFAPGTLTITETVPVSTTFLDAWYNGPSGPEYLTPAASGPGYAVFEFNGLTANSYSGEFYLRVQIDEAAVPGTELINIVQVRAHPLETYLDDNLSSWSGTLLAHNSDLNINIGGSWDLPNNLANMGITVVNFGDIQAGPFTITATYPVSMSLAGDISADGRLTGWQDYPVEHYFTATLSHLEAQNSTWINFSTQMTGGGPILGGQLFTFDVQASLPPEDYNPDNNLFSVTLASGPDLYVGKNLTYGSLYPGSNVGYQMHIGNRSTSNSWQFQGSGRITDTLPAGVTYSGSSSEPALIDGQTIVWDLGSMWAGWESWIEVYATISNTVPAGEILTNTAIIASTSQLDVDLNLSDNASSYAFGLREIIQVDLQVGAAHSWINGNTIPNSTVSVQTASSTYTTTANSWDGAWQVDDIGLVQPGATITVTAGAGNLPVVIHVPDPFSAQVDSSLEQVWGEIGGSQALGIEVYPSWGENFQYVTGGPGGAYTATFVDIPAGASGEVLYRQTIAYALVSFHHPYHEPYVNLAVDKSGNSIPTPGGNYIYQINYRNESGDLASSVLLTDTLPAGMTYLSDTSGFPASVNGSQVVWQLGDLGNTSAGFQLVAAVDPGLTPGTEMLNTVQIASLTKESNYGDNFFQHSTSVAANDTHLYINMSSSLGDPAPGSQYTYGFIVCSNGSTASASVLLTTTLPVSTTLTGWEGSAWSEQSQTGRELVLSNPSVRAWGCDGGNLYVQVDPSAPVGTLLEATGVFTASNDLESGNNTAIVQRTVSAPRIDQWVNKYFNGGFVVPGSVLQFQLQHGYDANFAPGTVTITDTLPANTSFVDAWRYVASGQEYLTPSASEAGYVVFTLNDQTANSYGSDIFLRLQIDEAAIPGAELVNTAQIRPHPAETNLDNNQSSWSSALEAHAVDLQVNRGSAWDLPNERANHYVNVYNARDLNAGPFDVIVTYPVSMSLVGDISGDWRMTAWQDHPDEHYFSATFSGLESLATTWVNFVTQMAGGGPVPPGQVFDFTYDVTVLPEDSYPPNNHAELQLASGPDFYIEKSNLSGPYLPGETIYYHLNLGNQGYTENWWPNGSVRITDTLPAGLTYIWTSDTPVLVDGQTIVWEISYAYPGWNGWINIAAQITNTARGGDVFTNTVVMAPTSPLDVDVNPADNTSRAVFEIAGAAFDISKQVEGSLLAGTPVTYTLSVTNVGNVTGTNLIVYDPLPAGLTYLASDGDWDGSALTWNLAELPPDESAQMWFSAMLPSTPGGTITNQNYQVTNSEQGVTSPMGAPLSFVVRAPNLVASFEQSHTQLGVGGSVTFTDTSTTDGFPITGWAWDLGDGTHLTGVQHFSHTYTTSGDFPVTLLVTDTLGFSDSASSVVHVTSAHFSGCADNTGNNATVVVPITATISDELMLEAGDEIAVYNSGNDLCAGVQYWTGDNLAITAWGDNSVTPEVDGLEGGEEMRYRIWDASAQVEYANVTASYITGDGLYAADSLHVVGALDLNLPEIQNISLSMGWNMIASTIDPSDPSIANVFSPIVSSVLLVKNGRGQVYWPAYHIDQIGNWNVLEGYQVYMTAARTLTITGTQVAPEATPISLSSGWSLISYLRDSPMPIETALSSLSGSLLLAKDGAGRVYWPQYHINQIGNMLPGRGYQVFLTSAGTLTYPDDSLLAPVAEDEPAAPELAHFNTCASGTGANATLVVPAGTAQLWLSPGVRVEAGDELAVFSAQSGLCAGALSWEGLGNAQALAAWGDDEATEALDGLQDGEAMTWKLWRKSSGQEIEVTVAYRTEDPLRSDGLYSQDGLYLLEALPQFQLFMPALGR